MKSYDWYWSKSNYDLVKFEILVSGPYFRHLNGVSFDFSNEGVLFLRCRIIPIYFIIKVLTIVLYDSGVKIESVKINGDVYLLSNDVDNFIESIVNNFYYIHTIEILYADVKYWSYELSCIIYFEYVGYPEDFFLNIELSNWTRSSRRRLT